MRPTLHVLFEDGWFVVVAKPSGMIVHRGWARDDDDALRCVRDQVGHRVHAVHRLDRGTSGVLLFARTPEAARAAQAAFEAGTVRKSYLALVRGRFREALDLDHPLRRDPARSGERVEARTSFTPVADSERARCSLVLAEPRTGRTHQIRRHLKHLSHPIVGDVRYGKGAINREYRENWSLHRLALHAARLQLPHPMARDPASGSPISTISVSAPVPADLAEPLAALGLPARVPDPETGA